MRTRLLGGIAATTLLLGLAACGSDDSNDTEATDNTGTSESTSPSDTPTTGATSEAPATGGECTYTPSGQAARDVELPPSTPEYTDEVPATIATSAGDIGVTLDGDTAPCTVGSFVSLAEQGYFDDTPCHRLTTAESGIEVLQCGDPTGTGASGPGYSFADELSGSETYGPGTLAMANAGPDTNGSQFFLVYGDSPLPPSYTVFGTVDAAGLKVVQEVAAAGSNPPGDGAPKTKVDITGVTIDG